MLKGIGSVLSSSDPAAEFEGASVWASWTAAGAQASAFATARAALAALLGARSIRRLWLPAYCCDTLADGARAAYVQRQVVDEAVEACVGHAVLDLDLAGRGVNSLGVGGQGRDLGQWSSTPSNFTQPRVLIR